LVRGRSLQHLLQAGFIRFGLGLMVVVGLLVTLYLFNPAVTRIYPPCPFNAITGLHCPGCGSLRAAHQLLHGNLIAALDLNPLFVLSLPFIVYYSLPSRRLDIVRCLSNRYHSVGWGVVIVLFWVLRNLPYYPFTILAP
ncbi:MAG TPA: DUF2752 domain-containing protein, partial [Armatimonadota bacterium]|nr:DUF2752 domain-containing protein [Armatimonadota bacterium]